MQAERKQRTTERQEANLKQAMLEAIRNCDEPGFMHAIRALGHTEDSDEYKSYQKKFRAHVLSRTK